MSHFIGNFFKFLGSYVRQLELNYTKYTQLASGSHSNQRPSILICLYDYTDSSPPHILI